MRTLAPEKDIACVATAIALVTSGLIGLAGVQVRRRRRTAA
jgi:hypothetical protein